MTVAIIAILGGFVVLILGAELLVRGATALALRCGISPLVVGLTVVAFGTSSPELVVAVKASLSGQGEIALGTVIGSNICNIALILGSAALVRTISINLQILRVDLPIMIGVTLLGAALLMTGTLTRLHGAILIAGILIYTTGTILLARREKRSNGTRHYDDEVEAAQRMRSGTTLAFIVAGPCMLILGSDWILKGAVVLAEAWGVSQAVVGLTVVAIGGSLPEHATSIVAAVKGKGDIAVGNVIGSNIFNILSVIGAAALASPIPVTGISRVDIGVMILLSLLLFPLMKSDTRLKRGEGLLMLAIYAGYLVYLFQFRGDL
jgi:cation:H+ antiporter